MTSIHRKIKDKVKEHIPKDWFTEIRISYRILIETFKGIYQTGLANILIITTMAAILTIFGCIFRITLSTSGIVSEMGSVLQISAYLKPGADVNAASREIREFEHVKGIDFISKEQAWMELKREIDMPDVQNPLPDTLRIKVDKPQNIDLVLEEVKQVQSIEDTSYAKDLVQKFQTFNQISHTATLFVVILSCILTITVINNTIGLVIRNRKDEIEIMRLMGVNDWYIKFPFVLQGAIYGFMGALIAVIPVNILEGHLIKLHAFFMIPAYQWAQSLTIFSVLFLGIAFSAGASFLSIKKHLEV